MFNTQYYLCNHTPIESIAALFSIQALSSSVPQTCIPKITLSIHWTQVTRPRV